MLASHEELARKLDELEKRYDAQFAVVFDAIRQLITPPEPIHRRIGLRGELDNTPESYCIPAPIAQGELSEFGRWASLEVRAHSVDLRLPETMV